MQEGPNKGKGYKLQTRVSPREYCRMILPQIRIVGVLLSVSKLYWDSKHDTPNLAKHHHVENVHWNVRYISIKPEVCHVTVNSCKPLQGQSSHAWQIELLVSKVSWTEFSCQHARQIELLVSKVSWTEFSCQYAWQIESLASKVSWTEFSCQHAWQIESLASKVSRGNMCSGRCGVCLRIEGAI